MRKIKKTASKKQSPGWKISGKVYTYFFNKAKQKELKIKKIVFDGFDEKPKAYLTESGNGFNGNKKDVFGGKYFLLFMKNKFGKRTELIINKKQTSRQEIKITKTKVKIILSYDNFKSLLTNIGTEANKKRDEIIEDRMMAHFSKELMKFGFSKQAIGLKISAINFPIRENKDHEAITKFIKKYFEQHGDQKKVEEVFKKLIIQGRKKTLAEVIKKFEKHIKNRNFKEKKWQDFLYNEVFYFVFNYIESIRETDVNFRNNNDQGEKNLILFLLIYMVSLMCLK